MDTTVENSTRSKVRTDVCVRQCTDCHDWRPLSEYAYHNRTKDHLQYMCRDCMREHHRQPFRDLRELAEAGEYVPTTYGGKNFRKHMERLNAERAQAGREHSTVRLHLGYGEVKQREREKSPVIVPTITHTETTQETEMALQTVHTADETPAGLRPAPATEMAPTPERGVLDLWEWLAQDDTDERGEAFQVAQMLIVRRNYTYTLYTLDGSAPHKAITDSDLILYIVRLATSTAEGEPLLGRRFY